MVLEDQWKGEVEANRVDGRVVGDVDVEKMWSGGRGVEMGSI
jgi:hypothetical protein